jgi:thiamine-monophosphate kinase
MVPRTGARPGDQVMVTGTIGDAAVGLDILTGGPAANALVRDAAARDMLIGRYRVPQPRNALTNAIRAHARSAMDVSDGLAGDLTKLCAASHVSAVIDVARIPISAAAQSVLAQRAVDIEAMICGGDDYEILCTVPEAAGAALAAAAAQAGVALTVIGRIVDGTDAPRFLDEEGRELALVRRSYSHF